MKMIVRLFLIFFSFFILNSEMTFSENLTENNNTLEIKMTLSDSENNKKEFKDLKIDNNTIARVTVSSASNNVNASSTMNNASISDSAKNIDVSSTIKDSKSNIHSNSEIKDKDSKINLESNKLKIKKEDNLSLNNLLKTNNIKTENKETMSKLSKKDSNSKTLGMNIGTIGNQDTSRQTMNSQTDKNSQTINIDGFYDPNKPNVITIKDGVKNININFRPNINIDYGNNGNKVNKSLNTIVSKNKIKKSRTEKIIKTEKNKMIPNKTASNNAVLNKTALNKTIQNNIKRNNEIEKNVKTAEFSSINNPFYQKQEATNSEQLYKKAIQLDNGVNKNIIDYNINNNLDNKNISNENDATKKNNNPTTNQQIYVVNRIINLDKDIKLSDEDIKKIVSISNKGRVTVIDNEERKKQSSNDVDKFRQKYDLIMANQISYGEVAFIDDYND